MDPVTLRPVIERDLPIFFEHQRDPEANHMAAFPARDQGTFMAHRAKTPDDGSFITRTVVVDGKVAGNVVSWDQEGRREVGYWIGREFWGKGMATRALSASWRSAGSRSRTSNSIHRTSPTIGSTRSS